MIARWNSVVASQDEVWHLGDFARTRKIAAIILPVLNGRKHLIIGNNDPTEVLKLDWISVQHYAEITVKGVHLVLCHYPFRTWRGIGKGWVNLHGHCHGRLKPQPRQFDVGVDVWEFRPVTLQMILGGRPRR